MKKLVMVAVFGLVLVTGWGFKAYSQNNDAPGNGLRISPTRTELTLNPGESKEFDVTVENISGGPLVATPFVNDFIPSEDESGSPKILAEDDIENTPYSIKSFIQPLVSVPLKPGEKHDYTVIATAPKEIGPGAYYGALRFSTGAENNGEGNIGLVANVASLVLINVTGDVVENVSLEEFAAIKGGKTSSIFESRPDKILVRLKNNGNTFAKPFGKVTVKNWRNQVVGVIEINNTDPKGNILPNSIRRFEVDFPQVSKYGRYKLEANLAYGEGGGNLIPASKTIWVLPYRVMIGLAILLVVAVWFATKGVKIYNRRVVERAKKNS